MHDYVWSDWLNYPIASQIRVWVIGDDGIPTGAGIVDVKVTNESFKWLYRQLLPRGVTREFLFRPVDVRGQELGIEFTRTFCGPPLSVYEQLANIEAP